MHSERPDAARPAATDLEHARHLVRRAGRVVALTGAGISTDSGIPDFRGPEGVWTRDPRAQRLSHIDDYLADPGLRRESWRSRLEHPARHARPNAAHRALAEAQRRGAVSTVVTQNIDGLHQRAGSPPGRVLELHGTMSETACLSCGDRRDMDEVLDRVRAGEPDPACTECGGILKSATVSFGQALDPDVLERARVEAVSCAVLLAAGTSLTVHPAAGLVGLAASAGASVVVCNATETPYDDAAAAVLRAPLGRVVPDVLAPA